jgi:hypothetical protein
MRATEAKFALNGTLTPPQKVRSSSKGAARAIREGEALRKQRRNHENGVAHDNSHTQQDHS